MNSSVGLAKIIKIIKEPGETLSQRVVRSSFWVFSLRIVEQGLSLIRLFIIARVLAPHDFGLMGIAMLALSILETFTQSGFQQALIQKKEKTEEYLNTAWTFLIIRSFIIFIVLYFMAPYAAVFFNAPEAKTITQLIGISTILQAFTNIGIIYFQKEIEFNKQFFYQLSGTLADFIVAVTAAIILRNVWALIFGVLAGNLARVVVSYIIHPYRPRLEFDKEKFKELFTFGKWIFWSSIIMFFLVQGDSIFIGKLLGATALGYYQMAYRIANMPATEISRVISSITFPAYAKIQNDAKALREAYIKVLQVTTFISFPLTGMIIVLAPEFIKITLGEKWIPVIPLIQALSLYGLIRSINALTGSFFQGKGEPYIITKLQFFQLIIMYILIYPLTNLYGTLGTVFTIIIPSLLICIYLTWYLLRITDIKFYVFIKYLYIPFIGTLFIILPKLISYMFYNNYYIFFITLVGGIASYLLFTNIAIKHFNYDILNIYQYLKHREGF